MKNPIEIYSTCQTCGTNQDFIWHHIGGDEMTDSDGNNYWVDRFSGECPNCSATNMLALTPHQYREEKAARLYEDRLNGLTSGGYQD